MAREFKTSPKGRAIYPHLHAPDTKFDSDGVYTIKLHVEKDEAQEMVTAVQQLMADSLAQAKRDNPKKKGIKAATVPFVEEEDGSVVFSFKMKAKGKRRDGTVFTRRPRLFDAKGQPAPQGLRVGGGSVCRVGYEPFMFYTALIGAGVSLRLEAVQVIELKEFGGPSAEAFGFGEEEGGFDAATATEAFANEDAAGDDADVDADAADPDEDAGDF